MDNEVFGEGKRIEPLPAKWEVGQPWRLGFCHKGVGRGVAMALRDTQKENQVNSTNPTCRD